MSTAVNTKFDEEFSKEARKTGGHQKEKAAREKPAEERSFWFLSLMSHMINTNVYTVLAAHRQEQTIIDGVAALKTTHEEAANCFSSDLAAKDAREVSPFFPNPEERGGHPT